jgi:hypothetical protein
VRLKDLFRLQARLDGELSEGAFPGDGKDLASHSGAQLLLKELSLVKSALARGEPERPVPQSRERYWRKIERAIEETAGLAPARAGRAGHGGCPGPTG